MLEIPFHCRSSQVCEDCGKDAVSNQINDLAENVFLNEILCLHMKEGNVIQSMVLTNLFRGENLPCDESILKCCHRFSSRICHSQSHNLDDKEK